MKRKLHHRVKTQLVRTQRVSIPALIFIMAIAAGVGIFAVFHARADSPNYNCRADYTTTEGCDGNKTPEGYFESVSCDIIGGWVYDPYALNGSSGVVIYVDGNSYGHADSTYARTDIEQYKNSPGTYGWGWAVPAALHDGRPHTFTGFTGQGNAIEPYFTQLKDHPSLNGNTTVTCAPPAPPPTPTPAPTPPKPPSPAPTPTPAPKPKSPSPSPAPTPKPVTPSTPGPEPASPSVGSDPAAALAPAPTDNTPQTPQDGTAANVYASSDSIIQDGAKQVVALIPAGTLDTDAVCQITAASKKDVPVKDKSLVGPYSIGCVDTQGNAITKFNKSATITIRVSSKPSQYVAYVKTTGKWGSGRPSANAKDSTISFGVASPSLFAAAKKSAGFGGVIVTLVVLIILGLIGWLAFAFIKKRRLAAEEAANVHPSYIAPAVSSAPDAASHPHHVGARGGIEGYQAPSATLPFQKDKPATPPADKPAPNPINNDDGYDPEHGKY